MSGPRAPLASAPWLAPPPLIEQTPRWVQVKCKGKVVADSKRALLLRVYFGPGQLPTYYIPEEDIWMDTLKPSDKMDGGKTYYHLEVGDEHLENAAWGYLSPPPELTELQGHITFTWTHPLLSWHEEAEQVFVHARDPYKRIDTVQSSRHVKVMIEGETVAETRRPMLLFETKLPTRYYIPAEDVNMGLLAPSRFISRCPYKGEAKYWSVELGNQPVEDVVWSYPDPIRECPKIKGLLCFFNERVDLYVDGELQPRPKTPWSR